MLRRTLTATAVLLALGAAMPASAQKSQGDVVVSYHQMWDMADKNKDGMVTKKEFMDAMSAMFDMQMKKMQGDAMMVKGDMLTAEAVRKMFKELYPGN
jgi:Ca2+-binding EF-hand superfamily protein